MSSFEWYSDFVDLNYKPKDEDLIALFKVKSDNISLHEAAGRVASESSVGTWTTLTTLTPKIRSLMAKVYEIRDDGIIKIAYPIELFEINNVPQILSSIAGNIFGMRAIKALKLLDDKFPRTLIESYKGPQFGIKGVRDKLKVYGRPITASVPKPKVGLTTEEYVRVARDILMGGIDLVKDDENLSNQKFNPFIKRLEGIMKVIDEIERETGERRGYLVNITAETREMLKRAKIVRDYGNEFVMVDILTVGWGALQTLRDELEDLKLAIHAHRAFHAAFTRNPDHGVSMLVVAKFARLIGADHIHVGVSVGKMEAKEEEVLTIKDEITLQHYKPKNSLTLEQEWYNIKPMLPVASGGLHPALLPQVVKSMGIDIIIQVGGGVAGHPKGPYYGAKAVRQALEAIAQDIPLEEYAEKHIELREALSKWGRVRPM